MNTTVIFHQKSTKILFVITEFTDITENKILSDNVKKIQLEILEKILHPRIKKECQKFVKESKKNDEKIILLNVPLLLEKSWYECDYIITISASKTIRKKRFLQRAKKANPKKFLIEKNNLSKKFDKINKDLLIAL